MSKLTRAGLEAFIIDPMMDNRVPHWAAFHLLTRHLGDRRRRVGDETTLLLLHTRALGPADLYANFGSENRRFAIWRISEGVIVLVSDIKGIVVNCTPQGVKDLSWALPGYIELMSRFLSEAA